TSGAKLIQDETVEILWTELFPLVDLITPNIDEAEILTGRKIGSVDGMKQACTQMISRGCKAVLLKGGHLIGPVLYDILAQQRQEILTLKSDYIESKNVHGTGCTLSAAIASYMALGHDLQHAVTYARMYIAGAIEAGKNVTTGKGSGPLNHSFSPIKMQIKS
ncbi:MAG TPA: PfkB family carbohydrate kinase, partial [Dyadobacter sp.]|nr:PfkB family carbohydrate kinase [Dyadobacter sp.]